MREAAEHLHFTAETLRRTGALPVSQKLHRHRPLWCSLQAAVDMPHASRSDPLLDEDIPHDTADEGIAIPAGGQARLVRSAALDITGRPGLACGGGRCRRTNRFR